MTIAEAMARIDAKKPNQYKNSDLINWLSELDGRFYNEVIVNAEGGEDVTFSGYTSATPTSTVLLIPDPYSSAYLVWLAAKIDFWNAEYTRFSNTMEMFNLEYKAAADAWRRTHGPQQKHRIIAR